LAELSYGSSELSIAATTIVVLIRRFILELHGILALIGPEGYYIFDRSL
jgi:hypothetical protein